MTFRQPAFMVDNPLGNITDMTNDIQASITTTETITDDLKRALVDGRQGTFCEFIRNSNFGFYQGIGFDSLVVHTTALNRLVIPNGHTFGGYNLKLKHNDSFSFTGVGPTTVVNETYSAALASASRVIDEEFASSGERYWELSVIGAYTGDKFQLSGVWIGVYEQLSSEAMIGSGFSNEWETQMNQIEYPSGTAVVELSPPRRKFDLVVNNVDPASADYATLDKVLLNGVARSFWYWPPDDTDAGPFLVRLDGDGTREQDFSAPSVNIRYRFRINMMEQLI